jgi:hypothetical protein
VSSNSVFLVLPPIDLLRSTCKIRNIFKCLTIVLLTTTIQMQHVEHLMAVPSRFPLQVGFGTWTISILTLIIGSGATVYVIQAGEQGINVSTKVDGGPSKISVLDRVPPPSQRFKVPLYDVQSLTSGSHALTMTILDWEGIFSGMMLDFILINAAVVAGPQPTTPASAGTTAATTVGAETTPTGTASTTLTGTAATTLTGSSVTTLTALATSRLSNRLY